MPGVNSFAEGEKGQSPSLTLLLGGQAALLCSQNTYRCCCPASLGWLPLGPWSEHNIKLGRKEGDKDMKCSVLMVGVGEAVKLRCENQA